MFFLFSIFFSPGKAFLIDKTLFGKTEILHDIGLHSATVAAKSKIFIFT